MKNNLSENSGTLSIGERYQLLVANISDYAIYMLDIKGIVDSWNAGAQRFKGYTESEIVGRHFSEFYIPEDRAAGMPERALETALREGKFEAEGWRVRKDGKRFWASVVIDPIYDRDGRHVGYAKITRDVTERKKTDEALLESERRFRILVQGVTDYAIYMLSSEGLVTNWNEGAQRIKGFEEQEVIHTHFSRFYTEEDRADQLPARALATAAAEGRYENEGWRVRKDGTKFWAHVVIDAVYDDTKQLIGFAKITRDITEIKAAQEELQKANAALFQAQKMEAIGQLTGGVAHDFNNLLGVISTGIDVINTGSRTHSEIKVIESMQRAIQRGATLTQQLLSFARQQPLKIENYNLNGVISTFESVLRRAGKANIRFSINLKAPLSTVAIDAARFEAALLNLVVNARDAMPDGGDITITTENVTLLQSEVDHLPSGTYVKIIVSDTGTGMSEDVKKRALEPFYTTKEVGKGTGLGLSQVYGFMSQSGGYIEIDSEPGNGTRISLYLPLAHGEVVVTNTESIEVSDLVLLVEDEQELLEVAAELVRSIGYDVVTATNGSDALALLDRHPSISILFSDVIMPNGMNGIELARSAKQKNPNLKVVLASGYPLPALQAEHQDIGEYEFMNKPYKLADLARKLRTA